MFNICWVTKVPVNTRLSELKTGTFCNIFLQKIVGAREICRKAARNALNNDLFMNNSHTVDGYKSVKCNLIRDFKNMSANVLENLEGPSNVQTSIFRKSLFANLTDETPKLWQTLLIFARFGGMADIKDEVYMLCRFVDFQNATCTQIYYDGITN